VFPIFLPVRSFLRSGCAGFGLCSNRITIVFGKRAGKERVGLLLYNAGRLTTLSDNNVAEKPEPQLEKKRGKNEFGGLNT